MKRYVLDSFALIAFFENEPAADKVAGILRNINGNKARGFMSVINYRFTFEFLEDTDDRLTIQIFS